MGHRHDPGRDAAAEEAGRGQLKPGRYRDCGRRRHHDARGERRDQRQVVQGPAPPAPSGCAVGHRPALHASIGHDAQVGAAIEARLAPPAGRGEGQDNVLADATLGHVAADGFDDAGALVPEHDRQWSRPLALDEGQVAAADARGLQPDQHLVTRRRPEVHLIDGQRLALSGEDGGHDLHGRTPPIPVSTACPFTPGCKRRRC